MFCSLSTSSPEDPCWSITLVLRVVDEEEELPELPLLEELPEFVLLLPELLLPESLPVMAASVLLPATPSAERPLAFWKL